VTPDPLIGRIINDRFTISALIARGGMGKVYRAEQAPLGRVCALKVLNPNYQGDKDPEFHKRFFLEASIASKLTHPNTVTIFDYGRTDDDIYYMAMEYLEGVTLHRAIREAGHFPEDRAAHVARQVCRALREAHALGVIHRDLKPANVFLVRHGDETDFVKVLDFGLVKNVSGVGAEELTRTGLFMGSPKYMAPEQIRGEKVDARTDVYALGVILYQMLTGKVPFDRPNSVNILMAHVNEPPPPMRTMNPNIELSAAMEEIVARCLAKDPDARFRSMDDVLAALKQVGGGIPSQTTLGGFGTGEHPALGSTGSGPQLDRGSQPTVTGSVPGVPRAPSGPVTFPTPSESPGASSPLVVPSPVPPSPWRGRVVSALAAGLFVAIIGYAVLRQQRPEAAPAEAPVASIAPAAPVAAASTTAAAPPAPAIATLRINTDPDGATVKEDGVELCSSTPCDIVYKGADADPARSHALTLARTGYRPQSRTVTLGDAPVLVKLERAPEPPRVFTPPPAPTRRPEQPSLPSGYKTELPY
jgi:serine/threonine-protein kinase